VRGAQGFDCISPNPLREADVRNGGARRSAAR
jgi:hypothetical protein